jgi:high-affinity nickel-transport protein
VFGGLSVLLYKPWRRRIDKKRARNAHFDPLEQSNEGLTEEEEELETRPKDRTDAKNGAGDVEVNVEPVEVTDAAGPIASSSRG